ncbi:MAG: hypothetical protein Q9Q40_13875, partial [Acidobacteriota bacterium]|nr:hypothetical protein [Acidobacteriota bacterium]
MAVLPLDHRAHVLQHHVGRRLLRRRLPFPDGASISRQHPEYGLSYRHGALTGVAIYDTAGATTPWQEVIPDSAATAGIEYNVAGGIHRLRYGNGTETVTDVNAAFLPGRIYVEGAGSVLFDTGSYGYDGARNIKQIGNDLYRYDLANRLDWVRMGYEKNGTSQSNDIDYVYDRYGNMTDRLVTGSAPPDGLHFAGRTYTATGASFPDNRIHDADFLYDQNGNLTQEPTHDQAGGFNYFFSPENRLSYVQKYLSGGALLQQASYDSEGNRWLRITSASGGKALITLRDVGGQVVAEYEVKSADDVPSLTKEYVRGAGGLLAIRSTCGPRPDLAYGNPRKVGTEYRFHKYDHIAPSGDYHIFIESESGLTKTLTRPSSLEDEFGIDESEFFLGETNWISIETTAECGTTGYSNALSLRRGGGGGGCLKQATMFLYALRTGFGDDGSSSQEIGTSSDGSD